MSDATQNSVALPARLDLQSVKGLKNALLESQAGDLALDASAVDWVSGLGAQLLLSAQASWQAAGHVLTVENASEAFVEGMRRLGVSPDLVPVEEY